MRIFKTKPFARFSGDEGLSDGELCAAVQRAEKGLIDADLGGGVIKQRVAREGQGKSRGFRTIILFRHADKAFFAYGFAKSDRGNINRDELKAYRKLAGILLGLDGRALEAAIRNGTIMEITGHG